jgi:hypothetical protein
MQSGFPPCHARDWPMRRAVTMTAPQAAQRWVSMPQRMHSNFVVRMVLPSVRVLKPSDTRSTLSVPVSGAYGRSSSDTSASPTAPQAGQLRWTCQLSRVVMPPVSPSARRISNHKWRRGTLCTPLFKPDWAGRADHRWLISQLHPTTCAVRLYRRQGVQVFACAGGDCMPAVTAEQAEDDPRCSARRWVGYGVRTTVVVLPGAI